MNVVRVRRRDKNGSRKLVVSLRKRLNKQVAFHDLAQGKTQN